MTYKIFKILNKKEIFSIIIIVLLSFFNAILELIGITLIIPILSFLSPRTYYSNASINLILNFFSYIGIEVFSAVCLLLIFIFLVKSFFSIYIIFYINRFNNNLFIRISDKIFKNYLFKDYVFHLNNHSSKILTDTNTETNYFVFHIVSSIIQILVGLIFLFYISCFLFFLDKFVFISLLLVFSFIAFLYSKLFSKKINKLGNIRYQNASLAIKQIQESLGGIKEVILFNVQKYFLQKYSFYNTNNAQSNMKSNTIFQIPRILFELLMVILITIYLFFFKVRNSELS
jgi:ATP-binding cassette subfamily C protein